MLPSAETVQDLNPALVNKVRCGHYSSCIRLPFCGSQLTTYCTLLLLYSSCTGFFFSGTGSLYSTSPLLYSSCTRFTFCGGQSSTLYIAAIVQQPCRVYFLYKSVEYIVAIVKQPCRVYFL
jgi:hypothetical protein